MPAVRKGVPINGYGRDPETGRARDTGLFRVLHMQGCLPDEVDKFFDKKADPSTGRIFRSEEVVLQICEDTGNNDLGEGSQRPGFHTCNHSDSPESNNSSESRDREKRGKKEGT
jgi:hypothetical protein